MPFDKYHIKWSPNDISIREFYDNVGRTETDTAFNSHIESIRLIQSLISASAGIFGGLLEDCTQIQNRISRCNVRIRLMNNKELTQASASKPAADSGILTTRVDVESAMLERLTAPQCIMDLYTKTGKKIPEIQNLDKFKPYMKDSIAKTNLSLTSLYSNPFFFFESWKAKEMQKFEEAGQVRSLRKSHNISSSSSSRNQSNSRSFFSKAQIKNVPFAEAINQTRKKITAKLKEKRSSISSSSSSNNSGISYQDAVANRDRQGSIVPTTRDRRRSSVYGVNVNANDNTNPGNRHRPSVMGTSASSTLKAIRRNSDADDDDHHRHHTAIGIVSNIEKAKHKRKTSIIQGGGAQGESPGDTPPGSPSSSPPDSPDDERGEYLKKISKFIAQDTPPGTPPDSPPPSDDEGPSTPPSPPSSIPFRGNVAALPSVHSNISGEVAASGPITSPITSSTSDRKPPPPMKVPPPNPPVAPVAPVVVAVTAYVNPLFEKYEKMKKILPDGPLRHKMIADGLSDAEVNEFFGVLPQQPSPKRPPPPPPTALSSATSPATLPAASSTSSSTSSSSNVSSTSGKKPPPPPPPGSSSKMASSSESVVVSQSPPPPPAAATAEAVAKPVNPLFEKYEKMKKLLPEGAIRHKMLADGFSEVQINEFYGVVEVPTRTSSTPFSSSSSSSGQRPPPPPPSPKKTTITNDSGVSSGGVDDATLSKPSPPSAGPKKMSLMDSIKAGNSNLKSVTPNQDKKPSAQNTMLTAIKAGAKLKSVSQDVNRRNSTKGAVGGEGGGAASSSGNLFESKEVSAILARRKFLQNSEETSSSDDGEWN